MDDPDAARPKTLKGQSPPTGFARNGELIETPGGRDFGHLFFLNSSLKLLAPAYVSERESERA